MATLKRRRTVFVVAIAMALCMSVFAGGIAVAEDDPAESTVASNHVSLTVEDVEAAPGDAVELEFVMENTGDETAEVDLDVSSLYNLPEDEVSVDGFAPDDGVWYESDRFWSASNFDSYQLEPGETQSPSVTLLLSNSSAGQSYEVEANVGPQNLSETATITVSDSAGTAPEDGDSGSDGSDDGGDGDADDSQSGDDSTDDTQGITATRSLESVTAAPGEDVEITVDISSEQQNIDLYSEEIINGSSVANITAASAQQSQVLTELPSNSFETVYLASVDSDSFTYTVSIDEAAQEGDTIEVSGTIADSGQNETDSGTTTIQVSQFSTEREPTKTTAAPGETVDISVSATATDSSIDVIEESIAADATSNLEIVDANADSAQAVINENATGVSVVHTNPVGAVDLTYTVEVADDATEGETLNTSGQITATDGEAATGMTTIEIESNPYADENGQVETNGLVQAITDWRSGNLTVDELLELIQQWRSR
jgi:hypothetical protein